MANSMAVTLTAYVLQAFLAGSTLLPVAVPSRDTVLSRDTGSQAASNMAASNMTVQGTVRMAEDEQLILDSGDERHRFLVPRGTMIVVNSAEADLEDIVPGYFATVTATHAGDNLVASFIDATRQYHGVAEFESDRPQNCKLVKQFSMDSWKRHDVTARCE